MRKFRIHNYLTEDSCSIYNYGGLFRRFEETGSVVDQKESVRPKVISDFTAAEMVQTSNEVSIRNYYRINSVSQVSRHRQMNYSTVWRILRKRLSVYPHELKPVLGIKESEKQKRMIDLFVLAEKVNN